MSEPVISLQGVWKYFGDFPAVRDVSFEVPSGTILALLGRNGGREDHRAPHDGRAVAVVPRPDSSETRLTAKKRMGAVRLAWWATANGSMTT